MNSIAKATFKAARTALRRFGLNLEPIGTSRAKFAGIKLHWGTENPGITRGILIDAIVQDEPVCFFITNEYDAIQREHLHGKFYEQEELDIISQYFNGGVFVDIGANIGNHSLYALKFLEASKVIAFEPNPAALRILRQNISANNLSEQVIIHPIGLSDEEGSAMVTTPENNLGGTRLSTELNKDLAPIRVMRGDDILSEINVDFIKIDTEGLELQVLNGLRETLSRCQAKIFVEIEQDNITPFKSLIIDLGYMIAREYQRYPTFTNFLLVPKKN